MGAESANNAAKSDFWIQDAKYLRLKNAQIAEHFPATMDEKTLCQEFKNLCHSVQNPLTFTKMKGGMVLVYMETVVVVLILWQEYIHLD